MTPCPSVQNTVNIAGPWRLAASHNGGEADKLLLSDLALQLPQSQDGAAGADKILQYPEDASPTTPRGCLEFRSYQRRAVTFIRRALSSFGLANYGFDANGCLYAAAPGLGKTPVSLQAYHRMGALDEPTLILGPLQAAETWCSPKGDPARYFGLKVAHVSEGDIKKDELIRFAHYDILEQVGPLIRRQGRGCPVNLIIDESHACANPAAVRSGATRALSGMASVTRRLLLTATPIRSGRHNLWMQLDIMQPGQWGDWIGDMFGPRYCGMEQQKTRGGQVYWTMGKPQKSSELRHRLDPFVLKVSRGTAASHGGTRVQRSGHWVQLTGPERGALQDAILSAGRKAAKARKAKQPKALWLQIPGGPRIKFDGTADQKRAARTYPAKLVALTHTLSAMAEIKVQHAAEATLQALKTHKTFVVFTERRPSAALICKELQRLRPGMPVIGPVTGAMPVARRWALCEELGTYKSRRAVLVATRASIGVSNHSLQVATGCLIVTPDWNPDPNLQVEGRMLAEGDFVKEKEAIYLFLQNNPVDERILERIQAKERDSEDVLGVGPEEAIAGDLIGREHKQLTDLLNILKRSDFASRRLS